MGVTERQVAVPVFTGTCTSWFIHGYLGTLAFGCLHSSEYHQPTSWPLHPWSGFRPVKLPISSHANVDCLVGVWVVGNYQKRERKKKKRKKGLRSAPRLGFILGNEHLRSHGSLLLLLLSRNMMWREGCHCVSQNSRYDILRTRLLQVWSLAGLH